MDNKKERITQGGIIFFRVDNGSFNGPANQGR